MQHLVPFAGSARLRWHRWLPAVIAVAVAAVLFGTAAPAGASPGSDEHEFLALMNQDRARAGMGPLVSDPSLAATSREWSAHMASQGRIFHATDLGAIAARIDPGWKRIGENVGVGYDAAGLHQAFMNSPGHKANIMGTGYNRVGIGVVHAGGKTWVTVRFLHGATITGITGMEAPVNARGITHACPGVTASDASAVFTDVAGNAHAPGIACVVRWNVTSGRTATTYEPAGSVTRQQLATFVANMLREAGVALPAAPADHFDDDGHSVHHRAINQLAEIGVVQGKGTRTYQPAGLVTRAEMATFLVRAHRAVTGSTLTDGSGYFHDTSTSVHDANINRAARAGIAAGVTPGVYAPRAKVTRAQMATFLSRTLDLLAESGAVTARP